MSPELLRTMYDAAVAAIDGALSMAVLALACALVALVVIVRLIVYRVSVTVRYRLPHAEVIITRTMRPGGDATGWAAQVEASGRDGRPVDYRPARSITDPR